MAKKSTNTKQTKKNTKPARQAPIPEEEPLFSRSVRTRLLMVVVIFIFAMGFFKLGILGNGINTVIAFLFGNKLLIPIYLFILGICIYTLITAKKMNALSPMGVGILLIVIAALILATYDKEKHGFILIPQYFTTARMSGGGLFGTFFYALISALFDSIGALIAAVLIMMLGIFLAGSRFYVAYKKEEREPVFEKDLERDDSGMILYEKRPKFIDFFSKKKRKAIIFPEEAFNEPKKAKPVTQPKARQKKEVQETPPTRLEYNQETQRLDIKDNRVREEVKPIAPKTVKTKRGEYHLPSYKLLNPIEKKNSSNAASKHAEETSKVLEQLFNQFGVNVHVQNVQIGPTVAKYELKLEVGTRVNRILQLQDDIKLALATENVRIEAPIPGKPYVGIEVPNKSVSMVSFSEVFQLSMRDSTWSNKLAVPLGIDVTGQLVMAEINKMPHLLVAGATGSGKSVCINSIITSILMKATPDEVKLILVDPKKVELTGYNGIPHLLAPVVTDPKKAAGVLQEVVAEMERRYDVFAANSVRNMRAYNTFANEYNLTHDEDDQKEVMPFIVVILDEVADLMMVASKTVEDCIMRIAQLARAAGIHMIVATQRPSTDIITGVIKANIPSRIAFAVSSSIDSRTILDATGAEKLLGKGDMLFSPMGASSPTRLQGPLVEDEEVERVVDFVSHQQEANYEARFVNAKAASNGDSHSDDELDEEYEECRAFVIQEQRASTSLLQRRFHIGYNKAARIIDQLQENGVIGPQIGSKPREVYIQTSEQEKM